MDNMPEKKVLSERLDVEAKKERILKGEEPVPLNYPYILPDYKLPFLHIGTETQMFLDNYIIDYMFDVKRVLEKPVKHPQPVMTPGDLPWEKYPNPICDVFYDEKEKIFKMWYTQSLEGAMNNIDQALCYAESKDGINWDKPLDRGCLPYNGIANTNITCFDCSNPDIIKNPDTSDEEKRYFLFYSAYKEGKKMGAPRGYINKLAYSSNGIKWKYEAETSDFVLHHGPSIYYDPAIKKYIAYSQNSHHWDWRNPRRQIGRQESEDLIRWSPKEVVISCESNGNMNPDMEFGDAAVYKNDSLYLAIVTRYKMEPAWNSGGGRTWRDFSHPCFLLATSRDGKVWNIIGDAEKPWVDNGPPGSIDYGYVEFPDFPVSYNGKLYFYYLAIPHKQGVWREIIQNIVPKSIVTEEYIRDNSNNWYGPQEGVNPRKNELVAGVGLFTLRKDGYMSIRPEYEQGSLLTMQFVFEGDRLFINADANYGWVKVEMLDDRMEPMEGFSFDDCDPIYGDSTAHEVKWKGNPDVSSLWSKPVRLKIYLRDAYLYSFKFGYK